MHKLAVIGDKDSIYGFALLGLDVYPTDNVEDKARLFKKLCSGNYGIIYITEALATFNPNAANSTKMLEPRATTRDAKCFT